MASEKKFSWEDVLNEHPLFSSYDAETRQRLIRELLDDGVSSEQRYSKDRMIIREGEIGESVYIVGAGSVRVVLLSEDGEEVVTLFTFRKGDTFGEMAIFDNKARSATVIANSDCTLLKFNGDRFLEIIRRYPELEFKILMRLSDRLRHTDKQILAVQTKNIDEKLQHFNSKLNAELKVIDASLKASQTVFEQTKMRTDEVINSAERSRSRLTFAASAIGIIISLFGFFGFKELMNVRTLSSTVEEKLAEIKESSDEIVTIRKNIEAMEADVNQIRKELQTKAGELDVSIDQSREFIAERVAIPEFEEALQARNLGASISAYEFIQHLKLPASSFQEKHFLLLMMVWAEMLNQLGAVDSEQAGQPGSPETAPMDFDPLLQVLLKDAAQPYTQMVAHFLLLAHAAATDADRLESYTKRFEKFMADYAGKGLTEQELENAAALFNNKGAAGHRRFERVKAMVPIEY